MRSTLTCPARSYCCMQTAGMSSDTPKNIPPCCVSLLPFLNGEPLVALDEVSQNLVLIFQGFDGSGAFLAKTVS